MTHRMIYRQHQQPGCGGCLLLVILLSLLFGGMPLLMEVFGMLLFVGLGLLLSIIAGFWAFSYFVRRQISRYEGSQTESHNLFVFLLVNILVQVAAADGEVLRAELTAIQNFFRARLGYSQSQILWVRELCKEAQQHPAPLDALLTQFRDNFAYEPRLILLDLLYQVLFTQPVVTEEQKRLARHIADFLRIAPHDQQSIRGRYFAQFHQQAASEDRYFEILGLTPGASWDEIRKAYRALSMQYHPDKVNHLGEEFKRVAEEKMKELNVAYQHLKERFG